LNALSLPEIEGYVEAMPVACKEKSPKYICREKVFTMLQVLYKSPDYVLVLTLLMLPGCYLGATSKMVPLVSRLVSDVLDVKV
jgi:hypothetical protein